MKKKSKKRTKPISFFKLKVVKPKKTNTKTPKVNFFSLKSPSYLTSHSKPQNLRQYVAGKKRLAHMDKVSFNAFGKHKIIPKKSLTWPQAKIRYPLLKPMKDADRDGVINLLDCRPFDKRRQGFFHKDKGVFDEVSVDFEYIKSLKTVGDVQRLEEDILRKEEEE